MTTILTHSVDETRELGARIARRARRGDVYSLSGELGTGKTEFVRGFVRALTSSGVVRSPSFSILNIYQTESFPVYHFDFYRLGAAVELDEIGFSEYASGDGVCLVEWAMMFPEVFPAGAKHLEFFDEGISSRRIEIDFEVA